MANVKAFAGDAVSVARDINNMNQNYNVIDVSLVAETVDGIGSGNYGAKVVGSILAIVTYDVQD